MDLIRLPVVCVLKSGGDFSIKHVLALYEQVRRNVRGPFDFYCLTDTPFKHSRIVCLKLRNHLPGWWSKMELFAHFDRAFYMDLDTVVLADISDMLEYHRGFRALTDFGAPGKLASGLMSWGNDYADLYDTFMRDAQRHMRVHKNPASWGDQGFLERHVPVWSSFQRQYPGRVVSYKWGVAHGHTSASIVCFHGNPRPWDCTDVANWGIHYEEKM